MFPASSGLSGRWAVLFLAGPKLLKPENLQVLEGAVVELLGEELKWEVSGKADSIRALFLLIS